MVDMDLNSQSPDCETQCKRYHV